MKRRWLDLKLVPLICERLNICLLPQFEAKRYPRWPLYHWFHGHGHQTSEINQFTICGQKWVSFIHKPNSPRKWFHALLCNHLKTKNLLNSIQGLKQLSWFFWSSLQSAPSNRATKLLLEPDRKYRVVSPILVFLENKGAGYQRCHAKFRADHSNWTLHGDMNSF